MSTDIVKVEQTSSVITSTYNSRWIGQVYSADLNMDGNGDLLILGASYPFANPDATPQPGFVAFGNGIGGFSIPSQSVFPTDKLLTTHTREVAFADFNGDGYNDFFIASHGWDTSPYPGEQNRLYLSNGDGTWRDASSDLPQLSDYSHSATVGDVNGDGYLDIFVGNLPNPNFDDPYLLINNGAGHFSLNQSLLPTGSGKILNSEVLRVSADLLTDLDGDNQVDLVIGEFGSTSSAPFSSLVLWNKGGSFANTTSTTLPFGSTLRGNSSVYDIQATDVNFDGLKDLVVVTTDQNSEGWELQILINKGNRTFEDKTTQYIPDATGRTSGIPSSASPDSLFWIQFLKLVDVNGDGRMDMVVDARGSSSIPSTQPVAYIHQIDGAFSTVHVSDIVSEADRWLFDYTTEYFTNNDTGGFVHVSQSESSVSAEFLKTTFAALPAADVSAPMISAFSPADESFSAGISDNIVLTFDEAIQKGIGNIVLKTAGGKSVETFKIATSTAVSFSGGDIITINPTKDLIYGTGYKLEIASGTIIDTSGNKYTGTTNYNFTTTDTLTAPSSNYTLSTKDPSKLAYSGSSNFTGTGNKSANVITGGIGNDTLNGKLGHDTLTGGLGNDAFVFDTKPGLTNIDTIADFTAGDVVNLSKKIFTANKALGALTEAGFSTFNSKAFIAETTATATKALTTHFIFDIGTGNLYYDADGSKAGGKDAFLFVTLTGVATLNAGDLHIV